MITKKRLASYALVGLSLCAGVAATPALAAPVVTPVNVNLLDSPYSFTFMGGTFSLTGTDTFPNYLTLSTSGGAAVRTVFGNPSTDFTNRSTVSYDQNILGGYGAFPTPTTVGATNGDNFLGLRVTSGGQDYYGFLFTTNTTVNSFGFETAANTAITATTDIPSAAVPEPATWAMMMVGVGIVGGAARRRRRVTTKVRFA